MCRWHHHPAVNQIKNPNNKQNKEFFIYLKQFVGSLSLKNSQAIYHLLKKLHSLSFPSHLEYSNSLLFLSSIILSPCPLTYSLHKARVSSLKFIYDQITSYWNDFSGFPLVLGCRMNSLTWMLAASHLRFSLPSHHTGHNFADTHSFCMCSSPTRFFLLQSKSLPSTSAARSLLQQTFLDFLTCFKNPCHRLSCDMCLSFIVLMPIVISH